MICYAAAAGAALPTVLPMRPRPVQRHAASLSGTPAANPVLTAAASRSMPLEDAGDGIAPGDLCRP
jgi:hypothetical protein